MLSYHFPWVGALASAAEVPVSRIHLPDRQLRVATPRFRGHVSRRDILRSFSALGLGASTVSALGAGTLMGCEAVEMFPEGVACGDPRPDGAVIWTRVRPPAFLGWGAIRWEVADDPAMERILRAGVLIAGEAEGGAIHVDVQGLDPDRWYWYRFSTAGLYSRVGRMRTAPSPGSQPDRLRYGFASCQQRNSSFYVAHRGLANEDIDFFMHLGDYIYASDHGDITLEDYRARWKLFKGNPLLQDLHAAVPVVATWDDGEFYNGVDRTGDPARLAAARRAWFESMPVIQPEDDRLHRRFPWGRLADVNMIDTRSYRDPEVPPNGFGVLVGLDIQDTQIPGVEAMFEEGRTTLGAEQKAWLLNEMADSGAAWQMVGNSYNINPWRVFDADNDPNRDDPQPHRNAGVYVSNEAWDDYSAERRELLNAFEGFGVTDVVFTSGHTHFYIASELRADFDDPLSPTSAFDFVTGSLTADPDPRTLGPVELLRAAEGLFRFHNAPYMKHIDLVEQGYAIVEVTPEETLCEFRGVDTFDPDAEPYTFARFRVVHGSRSLEVLPAG